MNKEYVADWDQAPAASGASAPSGKPPPAPLKQIVTIRLDVDTLAWFKNGGPGYQTRINQLLRDYMEAQRAAQDQDAPA